MSAPNFTPPPWSYYLDSEGYYGISHESEAHEPGDVAHVYIPGSVDPEYDDGNEGLANARLIAAAPDLLGALTEIVLLSDVTGELECTCYESAPCDVSRLEMAIDNAKELLRELATIAKAKDGAS